jgi:adenylate cyclase
VRRFIFRFDLIVVFCLFLLCIPAEYVEVFSLIENQTIFFRHLARLHLADPAKTAFLHNQIVIVTVDDAFFDQYRGFPLRRTDIGRVVTNISRLGAKVIGIDMLMKFTSSYGEDPILAEALRTAGNTVLASQAEFNDRGRFIRLHYPAEGIRESTTSGYVNMVSTSSVVTSLSRLRIHPEITPLNDGWPFAVQVLARFRNETPELVENGRLFRLGNIEIPLNQFNDIYIDFPPIPLGFRYIHQMIGISAAEFLDLSDLDEMDRRELRYWIDGKIVLIGDTSEVSNDMFDTPVGPVYGVEIIADTIATLLKGAPLRAAPLPAEILSAFLFLLGVTLISLAAPSIRFRSILALVFTLCYIGASTALYVTAGIVVSMSYALFAGFLSFMTIGFSDFQRERKQKRESMEKTEQIRNIFGRYLPPEFAREILESPKGQEFGGEKKWITVMMSDLRGFTGMGERLDAETIVSILNRYLESMTSVILKYRGIICHFIGDAILVIFGAPLPGSDDAERALACALEMQRAMEDVNEWNRRHDHPEIRMGIGIHTGNAVVGNIGSEQRSQYDVIGRTVNLASRIESYTIGGQIYVSEDTVSEIGPILQFRSQTVVRPKGVKGPITIYDVTGIEGKYNIHLPQAKTQPKVVPIFQIGVLITVVSGKTAGEETYPGTVIGLSEDLRRAEVSVKAEFEPLADVKITLDRGFDPSFAEMELYGKIVEIAENGRLQVVFSDMPPEVESFFQKQREVVWTVT